MGAIWQRLHMDLREDTEREAFHRRGHRQSVLEERGKRGGHDGLAGYDAGKKVKGRKFTPWSTRRVCHCASSFIRPACKIAMARRSCSTRSATAFLGPTSYGRTAVTSRVK